MLFFRALPHRYANSARYFRSPDRRSHGAQVLPLLPAAVIGPPVGLRADMHTAL